MRPDDLAWVTHQYRFSLAIAATTVFGSVRFLGSAGTVLSRSICRWFLALQIPIAVSVVFAVVPELSFNPSNGSDRYSEFIRISFMALLIPLLVQSLEHLRQLLLVIGLSLGFWGVKLGLFGLAHGGVMMANSSLESGMDNNTLALAISMGMAVCWYARYFPGCTRWMRWGLLGVVFSSTAAIVMSNSRGSSLALVAVFLSIVLRSKRKLGTLLVLTVFGGLAVYSVWDAYMARMSTLQNYEQEASAASRIDHAKAAFAVWQDYPVFGVGFGGRNYARLAGRHLGRENIHVAHNSYVQMLVDCGIFGFLIYVGLLLGTIIWLGVSAARIKRWRAGYESFPRAIQAALISFAVGSTFYSVERLEILYILLMCAAAWRTVEQALRSESAEGGESNSRLDSVEQAFTTA
jgi:probable O-glycosylation ligase (exosortase A-associated)